MDYSQLSMHDLFRMEAENQLNILSDGVLQLNESGGNEPLLEAMMRAAHSLKGAARIVQLNDAVSIAHQMEDVMVSLQQGKNTWQTAYTAPMLQGIDLLQAFAEQQAVNEEKLGDTITKLTAMVDGSLVEDDDIDAQPEDDVSPADEETKKTDEPQHDAASDIKTDAARPLHVRISPQHIERMLGLASEIQSEWQWLQPLDETLQQVKRHTVDTLALLNHLEYAVEAHAGERQKECAATLRQAQHQLLNSQQHIQDALQRLEQYDRMVLRQSRKLHDLSVDCRMQSFAHITQGLRRMVYDIAESLGKDVRLCIEGEDTLVDRDILEKIQAPIQHLLRNAVDHGIGNEEKRLQAGKAAEGRIELHALHQSGMLKVIVADDGEGIDLSLLKQQIVHRGHTSEEMVEKMDKAELLSFLFLPGFSMRDTVSDISGRGVGLDVVEMAVRDVQGVMHVESEKGKGTRFELHLPVSLAVTRVLHVLIAGQSWAVPLARLYRTAMVDGQSIQQTEGKDFFYLDDQYIGVVQASVLLGLESHALTSPWHVLILGQPPHCLGLIVDKFIGIFDLVEKPLPAILGKVEDIASCAILPDGRLLYVLDTQDVQRSMARFLASHSIKNNESQENTKQRVHLLVADDSITVRETERNMLLGAGYDVDVAVDGLEAWHMLTTKQYDLLVSDVDMPHMDGIELVTRMRQDHRFALLPVIMVSYKENERDRLRGLEAGADGYLAKSSFDNQSLLHKVAELLGED